MPKKKAELTEVERIWQVDAVCPYCGEYDTYEFWDTVEKTEEDCTNCHKTFIIDLKEYV
jgi:hypothetical protein